MDIFTPAIPVIELPAPQMVRLPTGEPCVITPATPGVPHLIELDTLVKRVDGKDVRIPVKYFYLTRDSELDHYEAWLAQLPRNAAGVREIAWDTETSDLEARRGQVATEQIGNPLVLDRRVYVCDIRLLSATGLARYLAPINDPTFLKLGQNLGFECSWGMYHFKLVPQNLYCTQVAELVLRAGLYEGGQGGRGTGGDEGGNRRAYGATSMAKLLRRYCGPFEIDKDTELRTSFYSTHPGTHSVRQIVYAGSDCVHPFFIREGQRPEIEARRVRSTLAVEFPLIPILASMELDGMAFNSEAWILLWHKAVLAHEEAERKLDELFLGVEGNLFGKDAGGSERKVCNICLGHGTRPAGEGWRRKEVECDQCSGTGRIGGGIRPIYMGGTRNAKPKPLNWGSPVQVKWAIRQYCEKIGWQHTLIMTPAQLIKVKRLLGEEWLLKRKKFPLDKEGMPTCTIQELDEEIVDEVPEYLIPEDTHCILLSTLSDILTLRMLRKQLPKKLVDLLLEFNDQKAKLGTFGRKFLENVHADGRVRFKFNQAITSTGRLSASPNSMNIPREKAYRYCFIAGPGMKLCIADYSQQEPRTSAYVSRDSVFLKNYERGDDLYITVAEEMLGYRPDVKSEDKEFKARSVKDRQAIKSTSLGLNYRMGPGKLRDKLTLDTMEPWTFEAAAELHKGYLTKCSGIKEYQEQCFALADPESESVVRIWDVMINEAVTFIESPCGRKRFFPPDSRNVYTEACNHPIQGCGATMTKAAMVLIDREVSRRGWRGRARLVNAIHDELVMEAEAAIAPEVATMMKEQMERAGAFYIKDVKIVASFPTSDGTADMWVKD
jgi:DNA polymerase I-like protein with 3'-5' exonuclease and polymerase domains